MKKYVTKHNSWIFIFYMIIATAEQENLKDSGNWPPGDKPNTTLFHILFELLSAYGTNGLSMGFPGVLYSLCGTFKPISKLCLMLLMLIGRHRRCAPRYTAAAAAAATSRRAYCLSHRFSAALGIAARLASLAYLLRPPPSAVPPRASVRSMPNRADPKMVTTIRELRETMDKLRELAIVRALSTDVMYSVDKDSPMAVLASAWGMTIGAVQDVTAGALNATMDVVKGSVDVVTTGIGAIAEVGATGLSAIAEVGATGLKGAQAVPIPFLSRTRQRRSGPP